MLADDDADDAFLFGEALMQVGVQMDYRTVENGRKLFELLSLDPAYRPDVIFLDINMPIMNGLDCLIALKKDVRYAAITTIVYSTSSLQKDVERAYAAGAALFITKPEVFEELIRILKRVAEDAIESLLTHPEKFPSVRKQ